MCMENQTQITKNSNIISRVLSAVVLIPPVVFVLWIGGVWFQGLLMVGGALMMLEWLALTKTTDKTMKPIGVILVVGTLWAIADRDSWDFTIVYAQLLIGCLVMAWVLMKANMRDMAWMVLGLLYTLSAILSLFWLRSVFEIEASAAFYLVLWVFLVVWGTDIGGYFFGKTIGGPKLAPSISPKKTWSGLAGGMILAASLGCVLFYFVPDTMFSTDSYFILAMLGALMAVIAQVGDLLESGIKRHFDVKDSGGLIPGHGGLLDRVDGLVTVSLAMAILISLGMVQ